jgi:hypothetical protein
MLLASLNWSNRAAQFFLNAEIETIEQLTAKSPNEISKCRNVGKKTLTEIRFRLGKIRLHLNSDKIYTLEDFGNEYEKLVQKKMALEIELSTIEKQIEEIDEARALEKENIEPLDENEIYAAWQANPNFSYLAKTFQTRPDVISEICWGRLEADCKNGTPPLLSKKIEKRFNCNSCGSPMVARYQNEPHFPKCPRCGRTSKNYFK